MPYSNLPHLRFSTHNLPENDQYPAWQKFLGSTLNTTQEAQMGGATGFLVDVNGYDFGKMLCVSIKIESESFTRSHSHIQADGEDGWLLAYRLSGSFTSTSGERSVTANAGDLELRAMGIPHEGKATAGESIYLYLSGDAYGHMANILDRASHTILDGTLGDVLKDFILHMNEIAPGIDSEYANVATKVAMSLIESNIKSSADYLKKENIPTAFSLLSVARRHIAEKLMQPALDANTVADELGVSRRQLYNVFKRYGGMAAYIRRRRLLICHDIICDITDTRQIQTIAYDMGFGNPTQFSRLFRAEFGYSPTEAAYALSQDQAVRIIKSSNSKSWFNTGK